MKLYNNIMRLFLKPERAEGVTDIPCSESERTALIKSFDIYRGKAPWLNSGKRSLSLASSVCSEISRLVMTEFSFDGFKYGISPQKKAIMSFEKSLKQYVEYACACGSVIFKPFFDGKSITVQAFLPFDFIPLRCGSDGKILDIAFIYRQRYKEKDYIRVEKHIKTESGYKIYNSAFKSEGGKNSPCSLYCVPDWASLCEECEISSLENGLFSLFTIPGGNPDNPNSPLGIPIFRRAEGLIKEADCQFERLIWEFEGGELAIDASEDAFRIGKDGKPSLPVGKERLYRTNLLDACCSTNELLKTFSPELRDKSLINGLNRILMFFEDACGIARGTFSDPSQIAKTATEVRASKQKTYCTVSSVQAALSEALIRLYSSINDLSVLYGLPRDDSEIKISFGDGVLSDTESIKASEREDVKAQIMTPDEFRKRWYGKDNI